ncbi:MAG: peptidylprolyl isomerase [Bacillota bacterium]
MDLGKVTAITVNGEEVNLRDVLRWARFQNSFSALNQMLEYTLVIQEAKEMGISVTPEELQNKADDLRRSKELYNSSHTMKWLEDVGMSVDDFEEYARYRVLVDKLRETVSGDGNLEKYFRQSLAFDTAVIAHIVTGEEDAARELMSQVLEEGADFYTLARQYSIDQRTRMAGGYVGRVTRTSLTPEVTIAVFEAKEGAVVGPVKTDQGYHIIKVEELREPVLDEETTSLIKEILFRTWIANKLSKSQVTFNIWEALQQR